MTDCLRAGSRVALSCDSSSYYFSSIFECVPLSIASTQAFRTAYQQVKTCGGGVVSSTSQLEALRFCQAVNGSLTITVNDTTADFSAMYDIGTIAGLQSIVLGWWD